MLFIFKPVAVRNYAVIMSLLPADEIKTNNSFYFPDSLVIPESNNTENNNLSFYLPDDVVAPELENILYIQDIINRTNSLAWTRPTTAEVLSQVGSKIDKLLTQ